LARWIFGASASAETGSDAGSNFILGAYTDAEGLIDYPISIGRAAGGELSLGGTTGRRVAVLSTTASTSVSTGSLINAGGFGCAGAAHIGGQLHNTDTTEATSATAAATIIDGGLAVAKRICSPKMFITEEGGFAVRLIAGENLNRGEIVYIPQAGTGNDGEVRKAPTSNEMPFGVVFANASAAAEVVVVVSGIAYLLPESGKTAARGGVAFVSSSEAGRADFSTSTPTTEHWREVGHFLDTGSGNGVITRAILHFN
jgi:hypothetical protein